MLENIYKIANEKSKFESIYNTKLIKKQFKQQQTELQNYALMLIEKNTLICNGIAFERIINGISRKYKRQFFTLAQKHQQHLQFNSNNNYSQQKTKILCLIICNIERRNKNSHKMVSFKTIANYTNKLKKIQSIISIFNTNLLQYSFECLKNSKKIVNLENCNLSSLDISLIDNKRGQFFSKADIFHGEQDLQLFKEERNQQIKQLKKRIQNTINEIKEYDKKQQQQIQKLKSKIPQFSCISSQKTISAREYKVSEEQQKIEEILVAKYIRKNFILEQKLQAVEQLLNAVQPDLNTQFGRKLKGIVNRYNRKWECEI